MCLQVTEFSVTRVLVHYMGILTADVKQKGSPPNTRNKVQKGQSLNMTSTEPYQYGNVHAQEPVWFHGVKVVIS